MMKVKNQIILLIVLLGLTSIRCGTKTMNQNEGMYIDPTLTRWVFTEELSEVEREVHDYYLKKIDQWWTEFQKHESDILASMNHGGSLDLGKFMKDNLQGIYPKLFWEFGPALHGEGHRLVITPETNKFLRPFVNEIINRAPQIIGWEFYAYRQSERFDDAEATVKGRTGGTIKDLEVQLIANEFNAIDVIFIRKNCLTNDDFNRSFNDAFVGLEAILGEEVLDKWVGYIDVVNQPVDAIRVLNIKDLKASFESEIKEVQAKLPSSYYYDISNESSWTGYELNPKEQQNYLSCEDLYMARTMNTSIWRNAHSNELFYSERHSKNGETFCFLKIDGDSLMNEKSLTDKANLENALDSVLIDQGLGSVVGGGVGLKYIYIDLALTDLVSGVNVVKKVASQYAVTNNAWILFFDSELESEWVGIRGDSPRPPMEDFTLRE